ncbi:MAG: hypothetical protein U1E06_09285, partial [Tabrizicola sp.]|nr:hypothetical protein [Tabrizicola sp.]
VRIRPNSSRRLKTVRGRRVITVPTEATAIGGVNLAQWVETERARLRSNSLETAFVFARADDPFDAKARFEIADVCLQAVREVTGRQNARLHALRHLVATEATTSVFLTDADMKALSPSLRLAPVPMGTGVALPRNLLGQVVELGHANPLTTLTHYHHMGWLLRSRSDAWLTARYANRLIVAPLLGVSLHTLDWANKTRPGRDKVLAWLDVGADVREVPSSPAVSVATKADGLPTPCASPGRWTARGLGALLKSVAGVGNLEKALLVEGAPVSAADPLRLLFLPMEARLGRRLLEETGRASARGAPRRRRVRRVAKGDSLEVLWSWFDGDELGRRAGIVVLAEAVYEYMQPAQGDRIALPPVEAAILRDMLQKAGINPNRIVSEPDHSGLEMLRILRARPASKEGGNEQSPSVTSASSDRYIGLVLKRVILVIRAAARCN